MLRCSATRRASCTSSSEQQRCCTGPSPWSCGSRRWFQSCIVRPMIACPRSRKIAATVELSTPPDIATATISAGGERLAEIPTGLPLVISNCEVEVMLELTDRNRGPLCRNGRSWRKAANAFHHFWNHLDCSLYFLPCCCAAEAESQARSRIIVCVSSRQQHVRRLRRTRRASRTRRTRNPLEVQRDQNRFAARVRKSHVRCVWNSPRPIAVYLRARNSLQQSRLQPVAKLANASAVLRQKLPRQFGRLTEADNPRHVLCPRTPVALGMPAIKSRRQGRSGTNIKRAHALRSAEFM